MEQRTRDVIFFVLLLAIVALGIYLIVYIHSDAFKFESNPYGYPISLLEKANKGKVECSCTLTGGQLPEYFSMNSSGLFYKPLEPINNNFLPSGISGIGIIGGNISS